MAKGKKRKSLPESPQKEDGRKAYYLYWLSAYSHSMVAGGLELMS